MQLQVTAGHVPAWKVPDPGITDPPAGRGGKMDGPMQNKEREGGREEGNYIP